MNAGKRGQRAGSLGQVLARDCNLLPQLDGRGLVVDSNQGQTHGAPNPWTWLKRLAVHTTIMTIKTMPER
jgi:hypothetical protein